MALEHRSRSIAVNVVAPGAVAASFSGGAMLEDPDVNKAIASHTAFGRVGGPEDVGPLIGALLSDDFRWASGQRIKVAGAQAVKTAADIPDWERSAIRCMARLC